MIRAPVKAISPSGLSLGSINPISIPTESIGAAAAGYWIWGEVPDRWVIAGGAVIIGSGLYIVHREVGNVMSNRYLRAFTAAGPAAIAKYLQRRKTARQTTTGE